nr:hypothetical protein [uncultured Cohaesibacter sp.]
MIRSTLFQHRTRTSISGFMTASLLLFWTSGASASLYSKATHYLIDQQIKAGCVDGVGRFDHKGVFEVDLNGDGKLDLVLSHQGLHCADTMARSSKCDVQFCSILVYFRQGKLLKKQDEFVGYILSFRAVPEPVFDIAEIDGTVTQWHPRASHTPTHP